MTTKLTIVIPANNEENVIISTLDNLKEKLTIQSKILVVDDHSTDKTAAMVKEYIKKNKNVSLVGNYGVNRGFSSTLRKGFAKAETEYVLPVMADLCDDPKTINQMYSKIDDGWDIVCGSRYMKGGKKEGGPKLQGYFSMLVCRSLKLLTGVPTHDVSNAFKMYKRSFLRGVRVRNGGGVEVSMEIAIQMFLKGAKITEIPTSWKGREVGESKFKIVQRMPRYWRIYFWSIKNSLMKSLKLPFDSIYIYEN